MQNCYDVVNAGQRPQIEGAVLNLSAPEILQLPAPQQGALRFGTQRPERPHASANPADDCADTLLAESEPIRICSGLACLRPSGCRKKEWHRRGVGRILPRCCGSAVGLVKNGSDIAPCHLDTLQ